MNLATSREGVIDVKEDAQKPFYGVSMDSLDKGDHDHVSTLI
ncbi:hypothetical protein ES703_108371 [subsurface metagenome]